MIKKTALFGGTFDPIHNGHIAVALYSANAIGTKKTILVPAKRSPHKNFTPAAGALDRIKMISLAIADKNTFDVNDCEMKRPEPSYTLETIEYFRSKYGSDVELYWLIGADSVKDLAKWYQIKDLMDLCTISVMYRAGFKKPNFEDLAPVFGQKHVKKLTENVIETPLIEISSTEIRKKIAAHQSIENLIHPDVLEYITKNDLYK